MTQKFAYLSQGKLFVDPGDGPPVQIESQYGQEVIDRAIRMQQRNEWKTQKKDGLLSGGALWGVSEADPRETRIQMTGLAQDADDHTLYYLLRTESVGGLFRFDPAAQTERRLFHKEQFRAGDLDWHAEQRMFACSYYYDNGTANILVMSADGSDRHEVTEGDSVDEAPSWVPGTAQRILFQSAGIALNQHGSMIGLGPFELKQLDVDSGHLMTILEDPSYDLLFPRFNPEGELFFVRRPYELQGQRKYGVIQGVADALMFPFRLFRAMFHFLNFMSLTFSRKPLTTASGPKLDTDDEKTLVLRGRVIDAKKALLEAGKDSDAPALVPNTWELVKRLPSGEETVLARGVLSYDLCPDGTLVYSNGNAVYELDEEGRARRIQSGQFVEQVFAIT
jgi:hypothetical protein